jgi:hypothetical protein
MMLRIIEMRGRMLGFFDKERAAGRFTITQDTPEGPRALSLEFVLPSGERFNALDTLDTPPSRNHARDTNHHTQHHARHTPASSSSSPTRIIPRDDDVVIERADRLPSSFRKRGSRMD